MEIVPKNPCHQLCVFASLPPSYFHASQYSQCTHARPAFPPRSLQLPPSYFHASQSIHARPALPSRSLQRRSPQAISKLFPGFPLRPRSCLPSFLPPFLPAFLPSLLIRLFCLAPLAAKEAKREPKHRRCFWEKEYKSMTTYDNCLAHYWCHEALIASYCHFWWTSKEFQKHQKQLPEDPGKALGAMAS